MKTLKNLDWAFQVLKVFCTKTFKNLVFFKPNSTALVRGLAYNYKAAESAQCVQNRQHHDYILRVDWLQAAAKLERPVSSEFSTHTFFLLK